MTLLQRKWHDKLETAYLVDSGHSAPSHCRRIWRYCLIQGGTTYWLSNRRITQRAATNALPAVPAIEVSGELIPAAVREWSRSVPSGVILGMIILAGLGICSTVIMRTRAELEGSILQYQRMSSEINARRRANAELQLDIHRMTDDPTMIESAARNRLGMVRPNDIVVPVQLISSVSALNTLSSVR